MKTVLKLSLIILLASFAFADKAVTGDCKCKGIPLKGNVRIVNANEDFKVRIVNTNEDLIVDTSWGLITKCGQWRIVNANEDFKVRIVNTSEDFKIRIVTFTSGLPNH